MIEVEDKGDGNGERIVLNPIESHLIKGKRFNGIYAGWQTGLFFCSS